MQVKFYLSQLADINAEVKDTACFCISELSQKVYLMLHLHSSLSLSAAYASLLNIVNMAWRDTILLEIWYSMISVCCLFVVY